MRTISLTCLLLLLSAVPAAAQQEAITLTTPIVVPDRTGFQPVTFAITMIPQAQIEVTIRANDGHDERFVYPCPTGECPTDTEAETLALIESLNSKVNMVTRSLWRRVSIASAPIFPPGFRVVAR